MKTDNRNIRLGLFVILATLLLITALYFIGNKQNLFGNTFRISARFSNVNGLMKGNNVRFSGIDVGTVESIEIINDSSVNVVMVIEKKIQPFIRRNAMISVGTDGLMGNKLVNINSGTTTAATIQEDDVLQTLKPVEMDDMIRTLDMTNKNMGAITLNLRNITDKINSENSLWSILSDTIIPANIKTSFVNIKQISYDGTIMAGNLKDLTVKIKNGNGSLGALINDTSMAFKFKYILKNFEKLSDTADKITTGLSQLVTGLNKGQGTAGKFLKDTTTMTDLNKSIRKIDKAAEDFDENMIAMRHSWPFRKYFRKTQNKTK